MSEIIYKTSNFVLDNPNTINERIDPKIPTVRNYYEPPKQYWLYALKLDHNKFYVGFTAKNNPYDRIKEHVEGKGASWTRLHRPVEVLEIRDAGTITLTEIKDLEHSLAGVYMLLYGANNVRGGVFNSPDLHVRLGETVLYGFSLIAAVSMMLLSIAIAYIVLRHYFNWW